MKYTAIFIILWPASVLAADPDPGDTNITQDTVQANDAINSPTSIMQNTQVNSGVTHDSFGGGVSCARTTLQAGVIQSFNGVYDDPQVYVGFNMPLGEGNQCEDAAQKQISLTHQRTMALQEQIRRDNEDHKKEMRKKDLMYADLLAKVCLNFHGKVVAAIDSTMEKQCRQYSPLKVKHGHEEADPYDQSRFNRVSGHTEHKH